MPGVEFHDFPIFIFSLGVVFFSLVVHLSFHFFSFNCILELDRPLLLDIHTFFFTPVRCIFLFIFCFCKNMIASFLFFSL